VAGSLTLCVLHVTECKLLFHSRIIGLFRYLPNGSLGAGTEINFHNFDNKILQDMGINRMVMEYFNSIYVIKEQESHFFDTK